jgi:putative inorganic carbon (HCO3(-)) transporter
MGKNSYFSDYEPVTRRRTRAAGWEEAEAAASVDEPWPVATAATAPPRVGPSQAEIEKQDEESAKPRGEALSQAAVAGKAKPAPSILKRGHILSYTGLFLYTVAVFFRPYEWSESLRWSINISFWFAIFTLCVFVPVQLSLDNRLSVRTKEVNLLLLLVVLALFSMLFSIDPRESWTYFSDIFIKLAIMFIVMVNVVRTQARLKGLLFLSLLAGCFSSVGAIGDFRAGNYTVEGYRVMGNIGVHGLFGNPDDMALHLVMMIPIALGLMFGTRNILHRMLFGGAALLMLVGTVFSFSRGCFLGLLAVAAVLGWKLGRRNRVVVFVLLAVAVVGLFALAPGYFATRIISIFDHSLDPVGSASARQGMLIHSIIVALRHPLLGLGMGAFHLNSAGNLGTHNAYTQVAAEMGLPALAAYVWFMIYPLKRLFRIERETYAERRTSRFYYLAVGLQASLVGYMIASTFYTVAFYWNIYYLVAYAICLRRMYESAQAESLSKEVREVATGDGENGVGGGRERFAVLDEKQLV